jgi:hypothetical protein
MDRTMTRKSETFFLSWGVRKNVRAVSEFRAIAVSVMMPLSKQAAKVIPNSSDDGNLTTSG